MPSKFSSLKPSYSSSMSRSSSHRSSSHRSSQRPSTSDYSSSSSVRRSNTSRTSRPTANTVDYSPRRESSRYNSSSYRPTTSSQRPSSDRMDWEPSSSSSRTSRPRRDYSPSMDWEPTRPSRRDTSANPSSRLDSMYRRGQADPSARVNDTNGTQNCYYTTGAALNGTNTSGLVRRTEIMQQDTAQGHEIDDLFRRSGLNTSNSSYLDNSSARSRLNRYADGDEFAMAYTRRDGTGHMIAGDRHNGRTNLYDFQSNTRIPESNIDDYFRRENISSTAFMDVQNTRHSSRMDIDEPSYSNRYSSNYYSSDEEL